MTELLLTIALTPLWAASTIGFAICVAIHWTTRKAGR